MKKIFCLLLVLCFIFVFSSCKEDEKNNKNYNEEECINVYFYDEVNMLLKEVHHVYKNTESLDDILEKEYANVNIEFGSILRIEDFNAQGSPNYYISINVDGNVYSRTIDAEIGKGSVVTLKIAKRK